MNIHEASEGRTLVGWGSRDAQVWEALAPVRAPAEGHPDFAACVGHLLRCRSHFPGASPLLS